MEPSENEQNMSAAPARIWARAGVLFAALVLLKCGLLFALRNELYQAHWRVGREAASWTDYLAYYGFVCVLGLNLWVFGCKCAEKSVASVRAAFAVLALVFSAFLLFTFHEGEFGYVNAVASGALGLGDLQSYLVMNLFFRPPFLAAWLLLLVVIYYVLVRKSRENQVVVALALVATAYFTIHLQEMIRFQSHLFFLIAVGIVTLISGLSERRKLHWLLAWSPWLLMSSGFLLFGDLIGVIGRPATELLIMAGVGGGLLVVGCLVAWRCRFSDAWSFLLPFGSVAFLILTTAYFQFSLNYRTLMLWGLTLPRYFLMELALVLVFAMAASAYCKWRPKGNLLWLDVAGLMAIVLAVLDLRLVQIMGLRIDWEVLSASDLNSPQMIWRMAQPYLPALSVVLLVTVVIYIVSVRWLRRLSATTQEMSERGRGGWRFAVASVVLLGISGTVLIDGDKAEGQVVASLVTSGIDLKGITQRQYTRDELVAEARTLGLESMLEAPPVSGRERRDLNVVLIFQESVYNKHLSLFGGTNDTQPLLSKYRDRMEIFPNFHSNFAQSIHARFATFTGLYPVQDFKDFTRTRVPVKSLFEVLNEQGYDCSMFYSSFFDYTNFRDFLRGRGLSIMYDANTMPGAGQAGKVAWGLKEEATLAAIQDQIKSYGESGKKFFLTYVPAAPHFPFDGVPDQFRKFKPRNMEDRVASYLNELLYMDWVMAEIIHELEASGLLDNTLVVITSDHGEMLGDGNGLLGHGWELTPELTNVPLIIMDPAKRGFSVNETPGSQIDLLPTLLNSLGIPLPADQTYQGVSLYRSSGAPGQSVYLNSHRKFAVMTGSTLVFGDRENDSYTHTGTYRVDVQNGAACYELLSEAAGSHDIERFDRFQENFLRHYADYVGFLRQTTGHQTAQVRE